MFVQPFPLTGTKWQITRIGSAHPFWSHDGKELFFDVAGRLYVVSMHTQPTFGVTDPVALPPMGFVLSGTAEELGHHPGR